MTRTDIASNQRGRQTLLLESHDRRPIDKPLFLGYTEVIANFALSYRLWMRNPCVALLAAAPRLRNSHASDEDNEMRQTLAPVLLALVTFAGCGSDELSSPTAARLRGVAALYMDCAVARNGKGPASEQEFKKHLRRLPDHVLSSNGMDPKALDVAFVSLRDQEPFVVLYGLKITKISGTSAPLVVHEKTGKNGKRLVALANGKVDHVDEARLKELMAEKP
jgi:hypothetical protein